MYFYRFYEIYIYKLAFLLYNKCKHYGFVPYLGGIEMTLLNKMKDEFRKFVPYLGGIEISLTAGEGNTPGRVCTVPWRN